MRVNKFLNTDGSSLWSDKVTRKVKVTIIEICISKDDNYKEGRPWGELKVYFYPETWNPAENGLIYTDKLFEKELREYLVTKGFSKKAAREVDYSEQGMQGDNYVSLDVGHVFSTEWINKYPKAHVNDYTDMTRI